MRNIKTLLEILLDQYQNNSDDKIRSKGLCLAVFMLHDHRIINLYDRKALLYVIKANRPKSVVSPIYWWAQGRTAPRIEFLEQLISKIENETWLDKLKRKLGL